MGKRRRGQRRSAHRHDGGPALPARNVIAMTRDPITRTSEI
jgi:hypothetical protein